MRKATLRRHAVDVNEEWPLHPDVSRSGRASVQPCRFQGGTRWPVSVSVNVKRTRRAVSARLAPMPADLQ
jgi:hypothetical protein